MKNKKIFLIILGIVILVSDQITKLLVIEKSFVIIPNILDFTYIKNTGVAFGIGTNNLILIIILNIIILGFIIKFLKERNNQVDFSIIIALILVLAGGISNLIDRIFRGYVIDFIDVNLLDFPCFNIADISITVGIMILIISIIKSSIIKEKEGGK